MQRMGAFMSTPPQSLFNFWCTPVLLFIFIPRHLKSKMGHYGLPSVQKFALSVRPSDRPSLFRFRSLSGVLFNRLIQTLYKS